MTATTNPLLIAIRATCADIDCYRVFTTKYKAGGFRVKMWGQRHVPKHLKAKLAAAGFTDITIDHLQRLWGPPSVVVRAKEAV